MYPFPECRVLRGRGRVLDGATFREVVSDADYSLYIHPPVHEDLAYSYSGYFSATKNLQDTLPAEGMLLELAYEHHRWQFAIQGPMAVVEAHMLAFGKALPLEGWVTEDRKRALVDDEEEEEELMTEEEGD
jgi:hypothetical protein